MYPCVASGQQWEDGGGAGAHGGAHEEVHGEGAGGERGPEAAALGRGHSQDAAAHTRQRRPQGQYAVAVSSLTYHS